MNDVNNKVGRQAIQLRRITCTAYKRDDGRWDVEGVLVDTDPCGMVHPERGSIGPEDPIHEMHVRLTIDSEFVIHEAEAITIHSPYGVCSGANAAYAQLVGIQIGAGFVTTVRRLFQRASGCTHITELLPAMATTAFQAFFRRAAAIPEDGSMPSPIDACHALRSDGEVVKKYFPRHYRTPRND